MQLFNSDTGTVLSYALAMLVTLAAQAAVIYVSPEGKTPEQGGDGTLAHPYDLPSALVAEGNVSGEFRLLMSDNHYLLSASIGPHGRKFLGWNGTTDQPAGREGRDKVVLDGQGTVKCVNSANLNGSWTFADLTICNGNPDEAGCLIRGQNVTGHSLVTNCVLRSTTCKNQAVFVNSYNDWTLDFVDCDFRDITVEGWYGFLQMHGNHVDFLRCNFFNNNQTTPSNSYGSFGYGSANFTDCVISNNSGVALGGFCMSRSIWTRCCFENNRNTNCGACIFADGLGTCVISDCVFKDNSCPGGAGWGGTCFAGGYISGTSSGGNWYVTNTVFVGNHSHERGGVMSVRNAGSSRVEFVNCGFTNNISGACLNNVGNRSTAGGTLWLVGVEDMFLDRCSFVDNVSTGLYAAVRAADSNGRILTNGYIRSCLFLRNRSMGSNGGSGEGVVGLVGTCVVESCSFIGNRTENLYGALTVGGNAEGPAKAVVNCLFYDNAHYNGGKTDQYSTCNANPTADVRYWNCFSQYGFLPPDQGNIVGTSKAPIDPRFVDAANDDYRLQKTSCCVNAGMNQDWMVGARDLQNNRHPLRIEDGRVDIGCYEFWPKRGFSIIIR